jgi:hypothetical protein
VLRCDVVGRILMKCHLSDMPELRLGLNDKLEDVTFHQCVNLVSRVTRWLDGWAAGWLGGFGGCYTSLNTVRLCWTYAPTLPSFAPYRPPSPGHLRGPARRDLHPPGRRV